MSVTVIPKVGELPAFPRIIPGLDGLRGAGLLLVIVAHHYGPLMSWAWVAMQIFFLLSGFLITNGLLSTRDRPFGEYLRGFYWSRFLRIAPPYYLYLGVLAVVAAFVSIEGTGPLQISMAATYLYNFYHASASFEASYTVTHFWSLAVEEQFYLLWPILLFFARGVALRRVLLAIILAGPLVRALTAWFWSHTTLPVLPNVALSIYVLPWSHFDAFAMGALVSVGLIGPSRRAVWFAIAGVGVLGLAQLYAFPEVRIRSLGYPFTLATGQQYIWGYTAINVCGAFIIAAVANRRFLPWLFESPGLSFLGRISYTVYIVHYSLQALLDYALPGTPVPVRILIQCSVAVGIAWLSERYVERPARQLRNRWWGRADSARASPAVRTLVPCP